MNQYRCETCNHKDNVWCELLNRILYFNERDFISEVGCASHSDFQAEQLTENQKDARLLREATHDYKLQAEREKVLDELKQRCDKRVSNTRISTTSLQTVRSILRDIEDLRQSKDGEL